MARPRSRSNRQKLLDVIDRPLGFYVLALLIVEGFIATVVGFGRFDQEHLFRALLLGVGMFVYITLTVTIIVWVKAHVLTFDRDAHLQERGPFGSDRQSLPNVNNLSATAPPGEAV